jgi:hypothetical protein
MLQEVEGEELEDRIETGARRGTTGGDESAGEPDSPEALERLASEKRNRLAALAPALDLSSLLKGSRKEERGEEGEEGPVSYRSDQLGAVRALLGGCGTAVLAWMERHSLQTHMPIPLKPMFLVYFLIWLHCMRQVR